MKTKVRRRPSDGRMRTGVDGGVRKHDGVEDRQNSSGSGRRMLAGLATTRKTTATLWRAKVASQEKVPLVHLLGASVVSVVAGSFSSPAFS